MLYCTKNQFIWFEKGKEITRAVKDSKQRELERLGFICNRDGLDGAIGFAKQGIRQYRSALACRNAYAMTLSRGYAIRYRRELVDSLVVYRRFLMGNGCYKGFGAQ